MADLGLVASTAAERGGNTLAGGLARAIELLRAAQSTANSISELAGYLRASFLPQFPFYKMPSTLSLGMVVLRVPIPTCW